MKKILFIGSQNNFFVNLSKHLSNFDSYFYFPHKNNYQRFINESLNIVSANSDSSMIPNLAYHRLLKYEKSRFEDKSNFEKCLSHAKQIAADLHLFFKQNNIDIIAVINGGKYYTKIPIEIAKLFGIKCIFFEMGYFRPNTLTIDEVGVNALSSISTMDVSAIDNIIIEPARQLELFNQVIQPEIPISDLICKNQEKPTQSAFLFLLKNKDLLLRGKISRLRKNFQLENLKWDEFIPSSNSFVFIPLQVQNDTQIVLHSTYESMRQFILMVIDSWEGAKHHYPKDTILVFKEHPEDFFKYDYSDIFQKNNNIVLLRKYPIENLLANALFTITVNSTVGIEALCYGQRVLMLGENFYDKDGIVLKAKNPANISPELIEMKDWQFNELRTKKFMQYLRYNYQVEGNLKETRKDFCSYETVVNKLGEIVGSCEG